MSTTLGVWQITIYNPDGSKHATGSASLAAPGLSKSMTIKTQDYTCGYPHELKGTQTDFNTLQGHGVTPWPDAVHAPGGSTEADTPPSWDATGGQPEPHE